MMGACVSSSSDEVEQKKKSQQIDKQLEEDSKKLRRECKILLLGKSTVWLKRTPSPARVF
jgi:guanine nucleotide-binding protein G(i) subunit alpha